MASGKQTILNLKGKVDASNNLAITIEANGPVTAPTAPIANLIGAVDANNQLKVRAV